MTDPNYTHYLLIIDRSGSMQKTQDDAQGGIGTFIKGQHQLPGKKTITLVQFDHEHETVYDFERLEHARHYVLVPRGMTRLLDAVGFAVTQTGQKLAAMDEDARPGKVAVLIVTDGAENDSREWSKDQVAALVKQQSEVYGWAFTYIGSSLTTFEDAKTLGISYDCTLNYSASGLGTRNAYSVASASAGSFASGQSFGVTYDAAQRKAAAEDGA